MDYNYKVVAELRADLSEDERNFALNEMKDLQNRLSIINIDRVTYCKAPPIKDYDDFGAVAFFFAGLKNIKNYFSRLEYYEYYDLWGDTKHVEV